MLYEIPHISKIQLLLPALLILTGLGLSLASLHDFTDVHIETGVQDFGAADSSAEGHAAIGESMVGGTAKEFSSGFDQLFIVQSIGCKTNHGPRETRYGNCS